jgi:hypothetical protein
LQAPLIARETAVIDTRTPQAGWYPDPTDSRAYRWWSGEAWTEHLTAAPVAGATAAAAPAHEQAASWDVATFTLIDREPAPAPFTIEEFDTPNARSTGKNRSSIAMVVIGLLAIVGYLGSLVFAYSTVVPLIVGIIGLLVAVPAFRRARVTADGMAISFLGVLLSTAASVLSILPLLPMILGIPSAADITAVQNLATGSVAFHLTVEGKLVADGQKYFGQAAVSANCPADALPTAGSTFTCTETLADGTSKVLNVTVTDATGHFTSTPAA